MKEHYKVNDANQETIDDLREKYEQYKKALSTETDSLKIKKAENELFNAIDGIAVETTELINSSLPLEKYEQICGVIDEISCVIEPNEELHRLLDDIAETLNANSKDS